MKRKRSLGGWCGLGLAIAAVAGGAYAGKRYTERNMLAAVLGSGVRAESVQWHWRQTAGCAQEVEIPLPNAKDASDQALQLYAPKLWFVYDQAALLRKRFILPRVVIEDAVISTSSDRLLSGASVDIDFGADVDLNDLVELPSMSTGDDAALAGASGDEQSSDKTSPLLATKATGLAMPWLDQLQAMCEAVMSDKSIRGRQVSVDADMLNERMQDYFGDRRAQAQRMITEARDIQQQLVSMDNVLRQPQLGEVARRLEQIKDQLAKLKKDIQSSGKLLDDQQSRILAALLIEKKQLLQQADEYAAPLGQEAAAVILSHMVKDRLVQPARAVILMADLMRKPLDASSLERGQPVRYLDEQQPEFAARSARINGKLEMDGSTWPFAAEGKFEVSTFISRSTVASQDTKVSASAAPTTSGSAQWHMTIQAQPNSWQLDGECPRVDGPCTVKLSELASSALNVTCVVTGAEVSGQGQVGLREIVSHTETAKRMCATLAAGYRSEALLQQLMSDAFVVDDQTPASLRFEVQQLPTISDCQLDESSVAWLAARLQASGTRCMSDMYRQAAGQLESLVAGKLNEQKGMTATLRNDTEQYLSAQQDELRRIQATVNSLMEQQQPNYYFARQPGDTPR